MGGLAEAQLAGAIDAMVRRDTDLAEGRRTATRIDALEQDVDGLAVRLLALRQPMANDLREVIIAALKISSDLERIGDYAKNIAKRTRRSPSRRTWACGADHPTHGEAGSGA